MKGKERKKFVGLLVVGLLALGLLAGCGEASSTAEPMADEQHLAAQQALTGEAIGKTDEGFDVTIGEMLAQINTYMAAFDDSLPRYEGEIEPCDDFEIESHEFPLTNQTSMLVYEHKMDDGAKKVSNWCFVIQNPATEEDWALVEDYFLAASYCVDRNRPGNLWQALEVPKMLNEHTNAIICNSIYYEYYFDEETQLIGISYRKSNEERAGEPGVIVPLGQVEGVGY